MFNFALMKDYLIVGLGLAGSSLAFRLEKMGKDFIVFDDESQEASKVAGGFMNPVVLKRFTLAWKADEQLEMAKSFYGELEGLLKKTFLTPLEIYRRFSSIEEQNNWFSATDKSHLAAFLDSRIVSQLNPHVPAKHGFGRVLNTARLDPRAMLESYTEHLKNKKILKEERFKYQELQLTSNGVIYQDIPFKKVIFCEGFGMLNNPFFDYLPMRGNKGEYIIIKAPDLKLEVGIKSSVFIFPAGEDLYAVGATYSNTDRSPGPTTHARTELVEKLKEFVKTDFEVVDQVAGLRPATIDRRPVAGVHPQYKNLYCCNGFGSRGILMAPWISQQLLKFIEEDIALDPEVDLKRFTKKWYLKT